MSSVKILSQQVHHKHWNKEWLDEGTCLKEFNDLIQHNVICCCAPKVQQLRRVLRMMPNTSPVPFSFLHTVFDRRTAIASLSGESMHGWHVMVPAITSRVDTMEYFCFHPCLTRSSPLAEWLVVAMHSVIHLVDNLYYVISLTGIMITSTWCRLN